MGALCGKAQPSAAEKAEKQRALDLTKTLESRRFADDAIHKLLLLGAGESGKSTLFKQLVNLYSTDGKSETERRRYVNVVFSNIVINAQTLADASFHGYGEPTTEEGIAAREFIAELEDGTEINLDVAAQLHSFWADPGIQLCYDNRAKYQLNDSTKYFFDRLNDITQPGWLPTQDDIVRTRVRTTGIVEHNFTIDDNKFKMFDVGGQRNERKKWIHCFENVTAVMFVAAISEFDQTLFEDDNTNRMTEAIVLFQDIVNSQWFKNTSIILFLNKEDLFREKIAIKNINESECRDLQDFKGNCQSFEETTLFLKDVFLNKKKRSPGDKKEITCHTTCATNGDMVKLVFEGVKKIILDDVLNQFDLGGGGGEDYD